MIGAFSDRVVAWYAREGRKDLPWQHDRAPYRVWVSEIMLQQTQVTTVIPYFQRFVARFPTVLDLADAPLDDVLGAWSGLGYYARARNLHRAAVHIRDHLCGRFPDSQDALEALPGIGRSTAAAIRSLAMDQPATILDGNVKRVLARHAAVAGWPGQSSVLRELWQIAESLTPADSVREYNQAMMDLGALVCTRRSPSCERCPVKEDCAARISGQPLAYPAPKPKRELPLKQIKVLLIRSDRDEFWLERRPPVGIWGGLWSLPEIDVGADPIGWVRSRFDVAATVGRALAPRRHAFTHFRLDIEPVEILLGKPGWRVLEPETGLWYKHADLADVGMAAPIARLLDEACDPNEKTVEVSGG